MKRIIVVGGSAGGINALCSLLKEIPRNFPAPILAVIHIGETANALSAVLQRCCTLKVVEPTEPQPLRDGNVYLAPANRHLVVKSRCVTSEMGPRENRHRPSVDTLFRSAARSYRRHVVAVVLTGALDDGTAGALAVKSRGGSIVVQDPEDAEVPEMPRNVMRSVKPDHCVKLKQIPALLKRLVSAPDIGELPEASARDCRAAFGADFLASQNEPFAYTCPECGGALLPVKNGKSTQRRCHVGHRFSPSSFSEAHADAVERALWVAIRKLQERQTLNEQMASDNLGSADLKKRFKESALSAAHDIQLLEEVLARL